MTTGMGKKLLITVQLGLILSGSGFNAARCEGALTLNSRVDIEKEKIFLSDIVREPLGVMADRFIANSPRWGSEKVLTGNFVRDLINGCDVSLGGASRIVVSRKMHDRTAEVRREFESALKAGYRETEWGMRGYPLVIDIRKFPDSIKLPPGDFTVKCDFPKNIYRYRPVSFTVLTDVGYKRRYSAGCRLRVRAVCAFTTRDMTKGETVGMEDIVWRRVDMSDLYDKPVTKEIDIIGLRLKRFMRKGMVIELKSVERSPEVRRGEEVFVEIIRGCLVVQATGKSLEDGWIGDLVLVRNMASGKIERYTVIDKGRVSPSSREGK